jgi:hypothetical protein
VCNGRLRSNPLRPYGNIGSFLFKEEYVLKAKDIFKKLVYTYKNKDEFQVTDADMAKVIRNMFVKETEDLIIERDIKYTWQFVNLLTEQNDKWNALTRMFKNNFGSSPIGKNDFRRRIVKEEWPMFTAEIPAMKRDTMPELETVLKKV